MERSSFPEFTNKSSCIPPDVVLKMFHSQPSTQFMKTTSTDRIKTARFDHFIIYIVNFLFKSMFKSHGLLKLLWKVLDK